MALGDILSTIQEGYIDLNTFNANPTFVLAAGQRVNLLQTGLYKLGDGVTQLQNLNFLGLSGNGAIYTPSAVIDYAVKLTDDGSGVNNPDLLISSIFNQRIRFNNITTGTTWYMQTHTVNGAALDNFYIGTSQNPGIAFFGISDSGNVGIGVHTPSAKLHVAGAIRIEDGTEGNGKVLVSDAAGNTSWENRTRTATVLSNANPSINIENFDALSITALATNITAVTITGTPTDMQPLNISILDNGSICNWDLGTSFFNAGGGSITGSTIINKITTIRCFWYPSRGKFGIVDLITEP